MPTYPSSSGCAQCGRDEPGGQFCSQSCAEVFRTTEAAIAARRAVETIPANDRTVRRRAAILTLLDSLVDEPGSDSLPESAVITFVRSELDRLWARIPTGELDPEVYYGIKAMRERLGAK